MRPSIPVVSITLCVVACKVKDPNKIDCDTEIQYNARKVEGNVNVGKFGAAMNTEVQAVRQVDQAVERYMARWTSICKEYNAGVHDKVQYREQTQSLRQQMEQLDALIIKLESAPDAASYQLAIKEMYTTLVPAEERVELELDFTVAAAGPGQSNLAAISSGTPLRSGSNLYFSVKPTKNAYVYLYQENAKGEVSVLFPHPQMPLTNPIGADQEVRIPPPPGTFTLNTEDIGTENVYIVASLQPIPKLGQAMANKGVTTKELNCAARALEYNPGGAACDATPRGLDYNAAGTGTPQGVSMHASSRAGDNQIIQIFSFRHEQ